MDISAFNAAAEADARAVLLTCADIPAWADAVVAGRPYADRQALLTQADALARAWSDADVDAALSGHPRIGERREQDDDAARLSQREQAGVSQDDATRAALREANAAYEARFDRIFLIRAAGREQSEILAEARRRLTNDDASERREVAEQLRQIAMLRLGDAIIEEPDSAGLAPATAAVSPSPSTRSTITTHVLDAVNGTPAAGLRVELSAEPAAVKDVQVSSVATATTDDDGRINSLGPADMAPGIYTLTFATGEWFAARDIETFYPRITLTFELKPGRAHLHVPILLSPFAYSTYRGS